ncbi:hypothetical protein AJ79_08510 [Helicocarpus griseus UAMH5409]|uniref:Methyltransferase domain-containing protein n=1 Tax=Helicocarpus griseus UAMH5409 TaxID=1447875 RepID=A0A2B7WSF8_9EURO|nr:hypothetical protein AJ79_08510 [Helicocarpus griseus UAMH5409]
MASELPSRGPVTAKPEQIVSSDTTSSDASQQPRGDRIQHHYYQPIGVDEEYENDTESTLGEEISAYSASLIPCVRSNTFTTITHLGIQIISDSFVRKHSYKGSEYLRPNDESDAARQNFWKPLFPRTFKEFLMLAVYVYNIAFEQSSETDYNRALAFGVLNSYIPADDHPSAQVLGVDMQPIQPTFVPPNVKFEIDDVEEEFTYTTSFDYIHCRYMSYSIKDWPRLVKQIYKYTPPRTATPAEFTDFDLTYRCDDGTLDGTTLQQWGADMPRAGYMIGRNPNPGKDLEKWVREAGFTNIVHKEYVLPLGPWAKDPHLKVLGAYNHMMVSQGAEAFSLRLFIKVLGWSIEEVQVLLAKVRKDLNNRGIHVYTTAHKVWGQKVGKGE